MVYIYADESCKDGHQYLILGGICLEARDIEPTIKKLKDVRDKYQTYGEVKWTKTSKSKLQFYLSFIEVFFELAAKDTLHFHCLIADTRTFNHKAFNQGSAEIGFNKLMYQLLLHKFGRNYGNKYRLYAHLDERVTKHRPEEIRPMLNACLNRDWSICSNPFKRVTFQNSKSSEILQLNDLIIGAIGFRKNKHNLAKDAAPHKIELANYIIRKAITLQHPIKITSSGARKFTAWNFKYK